ncbi:MAG: hypothetical protein ACLFNS_10510, partial [Desulfobacterales bacterium]
TGKELVERADHKIDMSLGWRYPSYGISAFLEGQYLDRGLRPDICQHGKTTENCPSGREPL